MLEVRPVDEDLEDVFRYLVELLSAVPASERAAGPVVEALDLSGALPARAAPAGDAAPGRRDPRARPGLAVLLGVFARGDDDPLDVTTRVALGTYGLGMVLPLATVWLATSSIGDLVEDRLLVYLWLKPVPRWQLPAAAVLATVTVVVPLVVVPLVATAAVAGASQLTGAIALACVVLGRRLLGHLRRGRAVAPAGAVVEPALHPRVGERSRPRGRRRRADSSIATYGQSLVADAAGVTIRYADRPTLASIVVPLAVGALGVALAVIRYRRAQID